MYSLILAGALLAPGQCANGTCPLAARVAAVATMPVQALHDAVRGGCSGTRARFGLHARGDCTGSVASRGGCGGVQVASVAPAVIKPPLPMVAPPVAVIPTVPPIAPPVAVQGPPVVVAAKVPAASHGRSRTWFRSRGVVVY